jgi:hypothetical protein
MPVSIFNLAHVHIAINHAPIIGAIFSLLLLIGARWRNSDAVTRAALAAFVISGLTAIPTYFTGEPAEHLVEGLSEVARRVIDEHEDWARVFAIVLGLTSLLSLWLLWRHRAARVLPTRGVWLVLVLGAAASAIGGWVALLGGQIHHEEARSGWVPPPPPPRPAGMPDADERD